MDIYDSSIRCTFTSIEACGYFLNRFRIQISRINSTIYKDTESNDQIKRENVN